MHVLPILLSVLSLAAEPAARHGVAPDLKTYPQASAKETLASVVKAIEAGKVDYVLAQLAQPAWVDERVKEAGSFAAVVAEAKSRLVEDPRTLKHFQKLLKDGEWNALETKASVALKEGDGRKVFFRIGDGRWFMEQRDQEDKPKK